jgi:UDP-glucose 4-epimerase
MDIADSRILVTGGAGFIGSHITESLVKKGADVVVYDNFSSGFRKNIEHIRNDIEIIEGDILNSKKLHKACEDVDAISHQAAQLEITSAIEEPNSDLQTNTQGSLNVFEAAAENNIEKVVYASSACVYGQAQEVPQSESHPTEPNWPYGVSKLAVDKYASIFGPYYNIPLVGLRYGITYGPREWYGRVMTVFLKRAISGNPPVVWGGDQVRDFVHVSDAIKLHNKCLERETGTTIYNVGTGVRTSIQDLAELVIDLTGLGTDIVFETVREGNSSDYVERGRLPMELKHMQLDPSKARAELDWQSTISLKEGLEKQYLWAKDNQGRWQEASY